MMLWAVGMVLFLSLIAGGAPAPADPVKVYRIPVSGPVEPGMAAFLKRALSQDSDPDALFVLEMDTFGGRVDAALTIVDTILQTPRGKTLAYVTQKAISAGALIALACDDLAMKPHTTLGDCAPIIVSQEGPKMMGEKFQSPLRAKFRTLARRNGYPEMLAQAMVSERLTVLRVEMGSEIRYVDARAFEEMPPEEKKKVTAYRTVVEKGELLTMDAAEANELGFASWVAPSLEEVLDQMGIANYAITHIRENWSESLIRLITKFSPILMVLGLAGLYTEIKSPGFGLPGLVGILCLGLVFAGQYLVGLADYTELLLISCGIILFGIELFILPGFGIAGIAGLLCLTFGLILALQNFVLPDPDLPWQSDLMARNLIQVLGSAVSGLIIAMLIIRYALPKLSRVVDGPYLTATLEDAVAESTEILGARPGDSGEALTPLRPAGKIRIGNQRFDALSQGSFIEQGSRVRVARIDGNRLFVTPEDTK